MDAVRALSRWYLSERPVVSVYLERHLVDGQDVTTRWGRLRTRLGASGVDAADLRTLDREIERLQPSGRSVALLASGQASATFAVDEHPDLIWPGPLPYGAPILRSSQRRVPYVVVLVDRTGGELSAFGSDGSMVVHRNVAGPDDEIERNAPGGWAQARYQRRAEDSWRHNAAEVAHELAAMSRQSGARLVGVAGDVRAVAYLRERLPAAVAPLVRPIEHGGGPTADGSVRVREAAVRDLVARTAREELEAAVQRLREAPIGTAGFGVESTLAALRDGCVETLFVFDAAGDTRQAWYGPAPRAVSRERTEDAPRAGRLVDVLLRAALGEHSRVVVLDAPPPGADDGAAALLRC